MLWISYAQWFFCLLKMSLSAMAPTGHCPLSAGDFGENAKGDKYSPGWLVIKEGCKFFKDKTKWMSYCRFLIDNYLKKLIILVCYLKIKSIQFYT